MKNGKFDLAAFERECANRIGVNRESTIPDRERTAWEAWCRELVAERDALRAELIQLAAERDQIRSSLNAVFPAPTYEFTKEELFAQIDDNPSFEELVEEVCRRDEK